LTISTDQGGAKLEPEALSAVINARISTFDAFSRSRSQAAICDSRNAQYDEAGSPDFLFGSEPGGILM
jgi:hypothetical protein